MQVSLAIGDHILHAAHCFMYFLSSGVTSALLYASTNGFAIASNPCSVTYAYCWVTRGPISGTGSLRSLTAKLAALNASATGTPHPKPHHPISYVYLLGGWVELFVAMKIARWRTMLRLPHRRFGDSFWQISPRFMLVQCCPRGASRCATPNDWV